MNTGLHHTYNQLLDIFRVELIYLGSALCFNALGIVLMLWFGPTYEALILTYATLSMAVFIKPILIVWACYYYLSKKYGVKIQKAFSLFIPKKQVILGSFALAALCIIIPSVFIQVFPEAASTMGKDANTLFSSLLFTRWGVIMVAVGGLLAPFYEELFFRQLVYTKLTSQFNAKIACIVVVLWFWLAHILQYWGNWIGVLLILVISIILTWQRYYFKSLIPSLITHFAYNFVVVVALIS